MIDYSLNWAVKILKIWDLSLFYLNSKSIMNIRRDLRNHLDIRVFGQGFLAPGENKSIHPVNPVKNKKIKIESIQHA